MKVSVLAEKVYKKIRNKVSLKLYVLFRKKDILKVDFDESILLEKWAYKDANCLRVNSFREECNPEIDLSIILPLYNSEKYIHGCMDNLLNQQTKYRYEIILVNDGSKDNTLNIITEYKEKYPNEIVIINQNNAGISFARNAGLYVSQGKYVAFMDHDDDISKQFTEVLMSAAYKEKADIVKSAYANYFDGKLKNIEEEIETVIDGDMQQELFTYRSYIFPGVYKRELFNHIVFPENYWYEDMVIRTLLYRQSKKFVHVKDVLYHKHFHNQNASFTLWNLKDYRCLEQLYLVLNMLEINNKLHMKTDVWFYQCIMRELSGMLVQRTRKLDETTKQMVFLKACQIVEQLYCKEYDKDLLIENQIWQRIFLNKEFALWKLQGGYY